MKKIKELKIQLNGKPLLLKTSSPDNFLFSREIRTVAGLKKNEDLYFNGWRNIRTDYDDLYNKLDDNMPILVYDGMSFFTVENIVSKFLN